ncbi:polyprenol phosphomannose-dependent alpha 1,6 mannosyltransferase MptB [Frankia sp. AgB1.9]|uniref:polyprenol phosphomannose-dependent alpha 1,6 mannosyltransferase MptB n=1 Tax=unclassified Frankia TaxID=2632575 RepID=UPI001932190D|nr:MULTISPECIES: polyprenol phosphomannose-dependent alpha 1,6 mannosyltransferase MptB [unclassified Frankia]MBL7492364.1 polyprenol phosphomannose-dependent alpha 1,6 mannosyltransferase MptB [Frankia sp. AgW1.1]MBL7546981.1 polyprenol phosphomannose-dependent alpha 1,6 mannosyltransferase MptB [Frankia sp. AgB1.9]MBL7625124.1 polyprenol phosphomannose-dependent alpha 1,6 mannosyltransferase MptB [Frankia sp. AgB1.8]
MWLVAAGLIAAVAAVTAEGRLGPRDPRATDPTSWWGILPPVPPTSITRGTLAGISALSVIGLCVCWMVLVRLALTDRLRPREALAATVAWATPFAFGPPLFSRDAYAYAAQGELARRGIDPATHGVAALAGDSRGAAFMAAVDPRWRDTHTPYGGGAVAVERLAATVAQLFGAGPTLALVTLRILAVLAVAALVACTYRLAADLPGAASAGEPSSRGAAGEDDRSPGRAVAVAVALVGANPVTVIHLIGGMHLDALVTAALAGALLLEQRRFAARPADAPGAVRATGSGVFGGGVSLAGLGAVALACFAGTVKATAFLGLVWLLVAHARDARAAAGRGAMARALVVDLAAAVAVLGLSMLGSGFGLTWLHALSTSGALTTGVAPASVLASLIAAFARLGGVHASTGSGSVLLTGARAAALAVAGLVCARLLWLAWRRPPRTARAAAGAAGPAGSAYYDGLLVLGIGGLAVALGSPVLYPWYLAPTLPMLGVLAAGWHLQHLAARSPAAALLPRRRCRTVVGVTVAGSIWLCGATLSPLAQTWRLLAPDGPAGVLPLVVTAVACAGLLIIAATVATRTVSSADRSGRPRRSVAGPDDDDRQAATR